MKPTSGCIFKIPLRYNLKMWVEEIQRDTTVCRCLFTAKLLYMFRAYIVSIIRST